MVWVELDQLVPEVEQKLAQIMGAPPPAPPAQPPPPPAAGGGTWAERDNAIRVAIGVPLLPANAPVTEADYLDALDSAVQTISFTSNRVTQLLVGGIGQAQTNINNVARLLGVMATNVANANGAAATATAESLYNQAVAHADADMNHAVAVAESLYNRAEADLSREIGQALQFTVDNRAQAQQYAANLVHQERLAEQSDVRALEQFTVQNRAQAQQYALGLDTATRNLLDNQVTILHGAITTGLAGLALQVKNEAAQAERDAIATVEAQLQPQLDRITTEMGTCLEPLCDTVTPNARKLGDLGKGLTALENVGILAVLAALVAEAVHDPTDSARAIYDAGGWADGLAADVVNGLAGL